MADGLERLITVAFWVEDFTPIGDSEYLDDREKQIIMGYFRDGKTLKDIGEELGITSERVRQIKNKAMDGVRSTLYRKCLSQEKYEEYSIPVDRFEDLSMRSRNALMRNNLRTAEAISKYIRSQKGLTQEEALMQIRSIGKGTAREICTFLKRKNLEIPV